MSKKVYFVITSFLCMLFMAGCENTPSQTIEQPQESEISEKGNEIMKIMVQDEQQNQVIFELRDSEFSKSLYEQLPLSLEVENFRHDEKIFYPPTALDTSDATMAQGPIGTLAYYEPWGDVVMYYDECGGGSGLYLLGTSIAGADQIQNLSGVIKVTKLEE